jgi:hypothetical protein
MLTETRTRKERRARWKRGRGAEGVIEPRVFDTVALSNLGEQASSRQGEVKGITLVMAIAATVWVPFVGKHWSVQVYHETTTKTKMSESSPLPR